MRRLLLVNLAVVLGAGPVMAKDVDARGVTRRFLKVESSTWDWFGVVLTKDGLKVGPEFFSVVPTLAVKGSAEGERHGQRATVLQGFTFGFAVAGFSLLMGSAGVRQADDRWSDRVLLLGASGIASMFAGFMCALGRDREALEAVNSYNYDIVSGAVPE